MLIATEGRTVSNFMITNKLINMHSWRRVLLGRTLIGALREQLSTELNIPLMQVQKYRCSASRVRAPCFWAANQIMNKPVAYFFDDM